ncbi:MAG: hypothetical protein OXQ89_07990 [Rhodospirillaceae bacterium]|nr:hypothetical protein [Rhodospirillaceae bacterium]
MNSSDTYAAIAIAAVSADEFHGRVGWATEFRDRLAATIDGRIENLEGQEFSIEAQGRIQALQREKQALLEAIDTTIEAHHRASSH